jgi:hypothetical protein
MQRPFEGIHVIDAPHVLAGPFATYQLALLGATAYDHVIQATSGAPRAGRVRAPTGRGAGGSAA